MDWHIEITDDDIAFVEKVMQRDFSDEERRDVLRCMESCDVQACPGSGKTTTLVAKLAIFVRKIPDSHFGICVLSHTNAARIEMEKSLGAYAGRLFHYPHFVGTIQSFVDRFLAIPAMISKYGVRPWAIDDDTFESIAARRYGEIPFRIQHFLNKKARGNGIEIVKSVRYRFDDQKLCRYKDGRERDFSASEDTSSYQAVWSLKERITSEGCIAYHDAFALANWYLEEYPGLRKVISTRFPFVFFDEMQDTDNFQSQILAKIFEGSSIVQCFGDANQAIYSYSSFDAESGWQPKNVLFMSKSYRLSTCIANLCQNVCLNPQELVGSPDRRECKHTIFLFDDNHIEDVIPAFGDLIVAEGLTEGPFKAVGAVGRKHEDEPSRFSISSYWPRFFKRRRSSREQPSLKAYFDLAQQELNTFGRCRKAREYLLSGLVQVVRRQGVKRPNGRPYTPSSLLAALEEYGGDHYYIFRKQLVSWFTGLVINKPLSWDEVVDATQNVLSPLIQLGFDEEALSFLHSDEPADIEEVEEKTPDNVHYHGSPSGPIHIEIDTIHSVKGQTHQATLLLETFYYDYDLKKLLPYLKGECIKRPGQLIIKRRLPLVYVAMTRPAELLCLAMRRGHVEESDKQSLIELGWQIEYV